MDKPAYEDLTGMTADEILNLIKLENGWHRQEIMQNAAMPRTKVSATIPLETIERRRKQMQQMRLKHLQDKNGDSHS